MKWRTIACLMTIFATSSACAADGQKAREVFRQMDRNGDRALQFTEIQAARAGMFDRLDTNRNDLLDNGEARTALERMQEARMLQSVGTDGLDLQRMDANRDGRISRAEFSQFIPDRLVRADTNGDRALSLSELRALRRH